MKQMTYRNHFNGMFTQTTIEVFSKSQGLSLIIKWNDDSRNYCHSRYVYEVIAIDK